MTAAARWPLRSDPANSQLLRLWKHFHNRKAWLFADTTQGANASATCYSLIESAKANELEPSAYIHHLLTHIAEADTAEKLEALLPWNVELVRS